MAPDRNPDISPYRLDGIDCARSLYKIGIFGWRKRCLYFFILLVLIMAVVNLALIICILRAQDFGIHGMGKLHITSNGMRMEGVNEFIAALKLKKILSGSPLHINSRRNLSLSAVDENNHVVAQVTLSSRKIVLRNKELYIHDQHDNVLLHADSKKMMLNIPHMQITVPAGLRIDDSLTTCSISSDDTDLHLGSQMKSINISGASGKFHSYASDLRFESLMDTKLIAKKGKILLDAPHVRLDSMRMSTLIDDHIRRSSRGDPYGGVAEVCMCKDGTLYLSPPHPMQQCKLKAGICS